MLAPQRHSSSNGGGGEGGCMSSEKESSMRNDQDELLSRDVAFPLLRMVKTPIHSGAQRLRGLNNSQNHKSRL